MVFRFYLSLVPLDSERLVNCKRFSATSPVHFYPATSGWDRNRIITKDNLIPNGEQWEICRSYQFITNTTPAGHPCNRESPLLSGAREGSLVGAM